MSIYIYIPIGALVYIKILFKFYDYKYVYMLNTYFYYHCNIRKFNPEPPEPSKTRWPRLIEKNPRFVHLNTLHCCKFSSECYLYRYWSIKVCEEGMRGISIGGGEGGWLDGEEGLQLAPPFSTLPRPSPHNQRRKPISSRQMLSTDLSWPCVSGPPGRHWSHQRVTWLGPAAIVVVSSGRDRCGGGGGGWWRRRTGGCCRRFVSWVR